MAVYTRSRPEPHNFSVCNSSCVCEGRGIMSIQRIPSGAAGNDVERAPGQPGTTVW